MQEIAPTSPSAGADLTARGSTIDEAIGGNMENYFDYTVVEWNAVNHVLTLGVAVFAAALVYFLVTIKYVHPRFRLTNILSAVVMVSAFLVLMRQSFDWESTFVATGDGAYTREPGKLFSNGFRYMNWSIDVPVLLVQMLVVLPLSTKVRNSRAAQFIVAGLCMIWTSWAAQFYEGSGIVDDGSATPFWVWYGVSWVFYIWILAIVVKTVSDGKKELSDQGRRVMNIILGLLLVTWTSYAVAIVLPRVWWSSGSGVTRQYIFTFADIFSKAVYGVLLGWVATIRSANSADRGEVYPDEHSVLTPTRGGTKESQKIEGAVREGAAVNAFR